MIAIGSDHGGFELKEEIEGFFDEKQIEYKDFGTFSREMVDYSDIAIEVAKAVTEGNYNIGIIICGTGIGVSIAANKVPGIRAALCTDPYMARMAREHNDANMLALGGRVVGVGLALEIVKVFINTPFSQEERHKNRINKLKVIDDDLNDKLRQF